MVKGKKGTGRSFNIPSFRNMSDKAKIITVAAIVLTILILIGSFFYYKTTSYYSLSQLNKAIKTHNTTLFAKHMDMDKITTAISDKMMDDMDAGSQAGSFNDQMKVALYKGIIRTSHAFLSEALLGFFNSDVVSANRPIKLKLKKMTAQGDYVRIALLENPQNGATAEIKLEKDTEKNYWRVISLNLPELEAVGIISGQPDLIGVLEANN